MNLGMNILNFRRLKNMSQEELAERMYVTRQTISLWETDQTVPTLDNLVKLKEIFGVSLDKLLCADEAQVKKPNADSLDTVCGALAYAMGVESPRYAAEGKRVALIGGVRAMVQFVTDNQTGIDREKMRKADTRKRA